MVTLPGLVFSCQSVEKVFTPICKATGISKLIRYRQMLGLLALFYACLHMFSLSFMLAWEWVYIVGAMALSMMIVLGVTSTHKMMRIMGRNRKRLHRLVYVAGILTVMHFLWLVKSDYAEPVIYGVVLGVLMLFRGLRLN